MVDLNDMPNLTEYRRRYELVTITNEYNETMYSSNSHIIFSNEWRASIVPIDNNAHYSVAAADICGWFYWNVLKDYGANDDGCFICDTEQEIINACEIIRNLPNDKFGLN